MRDVHVALMDFWESFGVPAFLSGHVPEGQPFPYITILPVQGDAFGEMVLTAFDWHRIGNPATSIGNVMAERADLMDKIAQAIPTQGKKIPLPAGFLILNRNPDDFQSYYDDPDDEATIGGRTSYIIRYYTT